jgi:1-aminocyclopropane-1-carboxylate deaminase
LSAERFLDTSEDEVLSLLRSRGQKPYLIPSGASTHPLGGLGFARWAFELEEQEQAIGVFFDTIVLSLASGSTLGGMLAGFKCTSQERTKDGHHTDRERRIIGIQAMTTPKKDLTALVAQIAQTAADKIGLHMTDVDWKREFEIDDRFNAAAYGRLDEATATGIKEFASLEGILTDPVYTGKAITGLLHVARAGELQQSKNVLFIHTGGQAALSAYPSLR